MNPEQDLKSIFIRAVGAVDPFTLVTGLVKIEENMLTIQTPIKSSGKISSHGGK